MGDKFENNKKQQFRGDGFDLAVKEIDRPDYRPYDTSSRT